MKEWRTSKVRNEKEANFCFYVLKHGNKKPTPLALLLSGTTAYKFPDSISHEEEKRRWRILEDLINEKS